MGYFWHSLPLEYNRCAEKFCETAGGQHMHTSLEIPLTPFNELLWPQCPNTSASSNNFDLKLKVVWCGILATLG